MKFTRLFFVLGNKTIDFFSLIVPDWIREKADRFDNKFSIFYSSLRNSIIFEAERFPESFRDRDKAFGKYFDEFFLWCNLHDILI